MNNWATGDSVCCDLLGQQHLCPHFLGRFISRMSVNTLSDKRVDEDTVCTELLALEELLWWGRDHLQLLGV